MKKFIKKLLRENIVIPKLRTAKEIEISQEKKDKLKNISWREIKIEDLGGTNNIAHLKIIIPSVPDISDGIIVDIQLIGGEIYQLHMNLSDSLQRLGLGYKIHKALIHDLGHLYAGKGRTLNNEAVKNIWDRLSIDSNFNCISSELGELCMIKNHPNESELKDFVLGVR
jgi:hypothetical protein